MTELSSWFILRNINLCRSKEDVFTFFYISGEPIPETGPDGKPTLQLIAWDKGGILQLGSKWSIEPSLLSLLKKDLSEKFPELQIELIRLSPAQISVSEATLYLEDESGKLDELQSVKTSGFPPFTALFNVQLSSENKAKVISSLNGRKNILKVNYKGSLPVEREARVSIKGDISREISALDKSISLEEALVVVELAILNGRLNVERFEDEGISQDLKDNIFLQAKEKAASAILAMVSGNSELFSQTMLESAVSRTETVQISLESSADISSWFPDRTGADHIIVTGIPITEPDKSSATQPVGQPTSKTKFVRLGFDADEMPVAFINLKHGDAIAKLVGPEFAVVSLPAEVVSELEVKTNYTDGGPAFKTMLPLNDSEGWTLRPEDLGLEKIFLDGSGPKATGSTDVRVRVVYRPLRSGKGTYDDRTIYFRLNNWTESWFIVTRSLAGLQGSLEFDWRETTADGSVVMHPSVTTDETEIRL